MPEDTAEQEARTVEAEWYREFGPILYLNIKEGADLNDAMQYIEKLNRVIHRTSLYLL